MDDAHVCLCGHLIRSPEKCDRCDAMLATRAAIGPDSERAEQVIADAVLNSQGGAIGMERQLIEDDARTAAAALRAAGLLLGPDKVAVDREALALWMANSGVSWQWLGGEYRKSVALAEQSLRAALSEPPKPGGTS